MTVFVQFLLTHGAVTQTQNVTGTVCKQWKLDHQTYLMFLLSRAYRSHVKPPIPPPATQSQKELPQL